MKSKEKRAGYYIYWGLVGTLHGHEDMLRATAKLYPDAPEFEKAAKEMARARRALLKVVEFYDDEPTD